MDFEKTITDECTRGNDEGEIKMNQVLKCRDTRHILGLNRRALELARIFSRIVILQSLEN